MKPIDLKFDLERFDEKLVKEVIAKMGFNLEDFHLEFVQNDTADKVVAPDTTPPRTQILTKAQGKLVDKYMLVNGLPESEAIKKVLAEQTDDIHEPAPAEKLTPSTTNPSPTEEKLIFKYMMEGMTESDAALKAREQLTQKIEPKREIS